MLYEKFHLAISNKLGWGDMLSKIAMPAIEAIVTNHAAHINDCTGDVIGANIVAESLLLDSWSSDDVFSLLASPYYIDWQVDMLNFIKLRSNIETEMRRGVPFRLAISKWYKQTF